MLSTLIFKDLLLLRWRAILLLAMGTVMPVLVVGLGKPERLPMAGLAMAYLVTALAVIQAGIAEEKTRSEVLLSVLPLSRRQVVLGRYAFVVAVAVACAVGQVVVLAGVTGMKPPIDAALLARCLAFPILAPIAVWALALPIGVRFGMTRAQYAVNIAILAPLFLASPLMRLIQRVAPSSIDLVRALAGLSAGPQLALALAVAGLLAFVSYIVSVRLYEGRDL